jgi:hypothetical protein
MDELPVPLTANAKLPTNYVEARQAIEACARIDQCADWANRMEALSSYAAQSEDGTELRKMCDRIQARAIRQCGKLLREFDGRKALTQKAAEGLLSRREAAEQAGLSDRQQKSAGRVANVPEAKFERLVESDNPPSVTKLAQLGTKKNLAHLHGLDPEDHKMGTTLWGAVYDLVEEAKEISVSVGVRGLRPAEQKETAEAAKKGIRWLSEVVREIDKQKGRKK